MLQDLVQYPISILYNRESRMTLVHETLWFSDGVKLANAKGVVGLVGIVCLWCMLDNGQL